MAVHHVAASFVTFNGWDWRGLTERSLQFGPIYVLRSADDLGAKPLPAFGKGMYWCNTGILALTLGPRPAIDPGPP
jgi:hypothetical protein